jgi:hypothetical protein
MFLIVRQQEDGSFNIPSGNGTTKFPLFHFESEALEAAKEYAGKYNAKYVVFKAIVTAQTTLPPVELTYL